MLWQPLQAFSCGLSLACTSSETFKILEEKPVECNLFECEVYEITSQLELLLL